MKNKSTISEEEHERIVKGIYTEGIGNGLMAGGGTLIALGGIISYLYHEPVFMRYIIVGLCIFGIGGFLKFYGERKQLKEE